VCAGTIFRAAAGAFEANGRHGAGYKLANDGNDTRSLQVYMGHRNIANTVVYTELSDSRFKDFWRD
jgi:type 1 fimbriae regulatory protein FimE